MSEDRRMLPLNQAERKRRETERGSTQADTLINLASSIELFHTPDGTAFADVTVNEHRETWPVKSRGFRRWVIKRFYDTTSRAPNSEALQQALGVVEARAAFDSIGREIHVRVAAEGDKIYLDLCDPQWRVIEIDAKGWQLAKDVPVRFRRAAGMLPLPMPTQHGSVDALRQFLNVRSEEDFTLVRACLHRALRGRGPYPVLVLTGEQGSAKSSVSKMFRALVDPSSVPLRTLPRDDRDLFIAANNAHALVFDNVSRLPDWLSDALCRIATGGGFGTRSLYTNDEETLFDAQRPIILNGIEDVVDRADLADRSIFLPLQQIPEERRRQEEELWRAFEIARPAILGALLDDIARGLRKLPNTKLPKLPRMADFALWATACEDHPHAFETAYATNRRELVDNVIEADPVASAVHALMEQRPQWEGTATALLGELVKLINETFAQSKHWPKNGRALSGRLTRAATFLRASGIHIERTREGKVRDRTITLRRAEKTGNSASASSSSSNSKDFNSLPADTRRTLGGREVSSRDVNFAPKTLEESDQADAADGADAKIPTGFGRQKAESWEVEF